MQRTGSPTWLPSITWQADQPGSPALASSRLISGPEWPVLQCTACCWNYPTAIPAHEPRQLYALAGYLWLHYHAAARTDDQMRLLLCCIIPETMRQTPACPGKRLQSRTVTTHITSCLSFSCCRITAACLFLSFCCCVVVVVAAVAAAVLVGFSCCPCHLMALLWCS